MMIPQMEPLYGQEEIDAVVKYMQSGGWLTEYTLTRQLEDMLSEYLGVKHCVMMPSGTMALYAALMAVKVKGDVVFVPGLTMVATPNAAIMAGGYPLFRDINRETLCLDLHQLRWGRDKRTLIYVSLNGRCDDMDTVRDACQDFNTYLIEDACQSLGSKWHGKALGTFGDIGCFSLSCQKVISTGNGGFCITDNDELAHKLRLFKDFGREHGGTDDYTTFGINLKFTDLQAVIGIEQVKKLPARVKRKKEIYSQYWLRLHHLPEIEFIETNTDDTVPWFMDILVDRREELIAYLKEHGIQTRPFYPALHKTPVYHETHGRCRLPVCEEVSAKGLWLPSALTLKEEEIDLVCEEIERFYDARVQD